jgi:AcrR family transcriptional regulator
MVVAGELSKRKMKTRKIFMDATVSLIIGGGYDKLTITAIAKRANYGRWTFYQYFENKEDIMYHIITEWIGNFGMCQGL